MVFNQDRTDSVVTNQVGAALWAADLEKGNKPSAPKQLEEEVEVIMPGTGEQSSDRKEL